MTLLQDGNYDFLSALTLSSSKIDLSLPFEDEFQSRLPTPQHEFQHDCDYTFEAAGTSPDYVQEDMATTDAHLAKQTPLVPASSTVDNTSTSKHCAGTTLSVSWNEGAIGKDYNLDEYHRGLLQVTGTDDRFFRPSFRRQNSDELQQQKAEKRQQQPQREQEPQPQPQLPRKTKKQQPQQQPQTQRERQHVWKPQRKPVLQVCTTFESKPRHRNVVRPSNRHIPQSAFNRESFWIDEDEGVTPRVTLTRYDLRADEKDIYAWKGNPTCKRSAISSCKRNAIYMAPSL
ncbi:hypothetical protein E4U55_001759 [Claviceps digitariae]|nr:hypothetical protein E4U55_001759 [Claviceps digitariae]